MRQCQYICFPLLILKHHRPGHRNIHPKGVCHIFIYNVQVCYHGTYAKISSDWPRFGSYLIFVTNATNIFV